jgi:hypothetical protein
MSMVGGVRAAVATFAPLRRNAPRVTVRKRIMIRTVVTVIGAEIMAKSHLKLITSTAVNRTVVTPTRLPNAELRTREYLTDAEVERLIEAAKGNRHGHRDATKSTTSAVGDRSPELPKLQTICRVRDSHPEPNPPPTGVAILRLPSCPMTASTLYLSPPSYWGFTAMGAVIGRCSRQLIFQCSKII